MKEPHNSFLDYFLKILPGILGMILLVIVINAIHVTKLSTRLDSPMEPTLEISAEGDTTYIYEMHNNDTTDVTFHIDFK